MATTDYTQAAGMDGETTTDNVTELAEQAAASASAAAADLVETNQDTIDTAADVVATGVDRSAVAADLVLTDADTVATAADRVQTGLDVISTAADRVVTTQDALDTAADVVLTNADAAATAADLLLTDADTVATAADRVQTGLDAAATAADLVETAQDVIDAAASAAAAASAVTDAIGVTVQAYDAVLDGTTASYTTAEETKLSGIEALADVTDAANVTAAGALMDSELTSIAAIKALDQGVGTTDSPTFAGLYLGGTVAANYLDDYEEGTWTPVYAGSTASGSSGAAVQGTYTKIGNLVTVTAGFNNITSSAAAGDLRINGLPFTPSTGIDGHGACIASALGTDVLSATAKGSETFIRIRVATTTVYKTVVNASGIYLFTTLTYATDS